MLLKEYFITKNELGEPRPLPNLKNGKVERLLL